MYSTRHPRPHSCRALWFCAIIASFVGLAVVSPRAWAAAPAPVVLKVVEPRAPPEIVPKVPSPRRVETPPPLSTGKLITGAVIGGVGGAVLVGASIAAAFRSVALYAIPGVAVLSVSHLAVGIPLMVSGIRAKKRRRRWIEHNRVVAQVAAAPGRRSFSFQVSRRF